MKIIAYTALHYGTDYLASAIYSIIDHVSEYWVLYSPVGSHGTRSTAVCPDSRDHLYGIAKTVAGDKLRWIDGQWATEGQQRDAIHTLVPDADCVLVLDADEIWQNVNQVIAGANFIAAGRVRVDMVHFWRSFHRAVTSDPAYPERLIFPGRDGEATVSGNPIAHMGYAQRSEIVRYKLAVHGHRGEFRRDVDWYTDIFAANRQHDCHPVGSEYWNPVEVNATDYLPGWMMIHPYACLEVIP